MKEIYLYGCEECGIVISLEQDKGAVFYVVSCSGCKDNGRFYEKIVVKNKYDMLWNNGNILRRNMFCIEEKNDTTEKDTREENTREEDTRI
jgi:hypothetical protein